jgi:hypothetical protein
MHRPAPAQSNAQAMKQVMKRKDQIVLLSSPELENKPVLLLLHGATDDPTEMMDIVKDCAGKYNVLLYAYNQHHNIEKLASHLVREVQTLKARIRRSDHGRAANLTVVTYSYSAVIFRKAVLESNDSTLFSNCSVIQLVPPAGGSYLARKMANPVISFLVSAFSKPSAATNPYGRIADELWGTAGNKRFFEVIDRERMYTILVEHDPHCITNVANAELRSRYRNAIGSNIIVIPLSTGVSHNYLPSHPAALKVLKELLEPAPMMATTDPTKAQSAQAKVASQARVN